eukprot:COSAG05_NODE_10158_length_580_cov_1.002079_1_plen_78_part_00
MILGGAGFPQPAAGLPPFTPANGSHHNEAVMGYSVRTDTWRYTEWVGFDPVAGKIAQPVMYYGKELYLPWGISHWYR